MNKLFISVLCIFGLYGNSYAVPSYLTNFENTYPAAVGSVIDNCNLCHTSVPSRNSFGSAFGSASHSFTTIQNVDSDGDGYINLKEIQDFTFPGNATNIPQKPVVTAFVLPATSTSLTVPITTLTATDNAKVKVYKFTSTNVRPAANSTGWKAKPTTCVFPAAGIQRVWVWAKDYAGLVSINKKSARVIITLPAAPFIMSIPLFAVDTYTELPDGTMELLDSQDVDNLSDVDLQTLYDANDIPITISIGKNK